MSAIFYHSEDQRKLILEARDRSLSKGQKVFTQILPASVFYPAEEYHQKYSLQKDQDLMEMLSELYPDRQDLLDSTAAARLNGYLAAHLTFDELRETLCRIEELSPNLRERILNGISTLRRR